MKRVNIYISKLQEAKLKKLSKKIDLSVSEIVRRAIDKYIQA